MTDQPNDEPPGQAEAVAVDNDAPLTLPEIRERVPSSTYRWLFEAEAAEADETLADNTSIDFFASPDDEEEEKWLRVQEWRSSKTKADGFGGYVDSEEGDPNAEQPEEEILVSYVLSSTSGGHGDDLWAASRHVSNRLANAGSCRDLLSPIWRGEDDNTIKNPLHPLNGLRFLELGAGAGLPSFTAMHRGAIVVCTDQSIPDRVRCMAESAQRNWRAIMKNASSKAEKACTLENAAKARVCAYDWGTPTKEIAEAQHGTLTKKAEFDVVVAADCVYMPDFHEALLQSILLLLSDNGVALLPFALHGNTQDDKIWSIVGLAEQEGFRVEKLGSLQLTPQAHGMETKRALVHMLRLTRRSWRIVRFQSYTGQCIL